MGDLLELLFDDLLICRLTMNVLRILGQRKLGPPDCQCPTSAYLDDILKGISRSAAYMVCLVSNFHYLLTSNYSRSHIQVRHFI